MGIFFWIHTCPMTFSILKTWPVSCKHQVQGNSLDISTRPFCPPKFLTFFSSTNSFSAAVHLFTSCSYLLGKRWDQLLGHLEAGALSEYLGGLGCFGISAFSRQKFVGTDKKKSNWKSCLNSLPWELTCIWDLQWASRCCSAPAPSAPARAAVSPASSAGCRWKYWRRAWSSSGMAGCAFGGRPIWWPAACSAAPDAAPEFRMQSTCEDASYRDQMNVGEHTFSSELILQGQIMVWRQQEDKRKALQPLKPKNPKASWACCSAILQGSPTAFVAATGTVGSLSRSVGWYRGNHHLWVGGNAAYKGCLHGERAAVQEFTQIP